MLAPSLLYWKVQTGHSTPGEASLVLSRGKQNISIILPRHDGNIPPNAAQITIQCGKATLLVCHHSAAHQHPKILFCKTSFQLGDTKYWYLGTPNNSSWAPWGSWQLISSICQVPLDGSINLLYTTHFAKLCDICRLTEDTLCPFIQIVNWLDRVNLHIFTDYTKLGGVADSLEGCAAIQMLERWADKNLTSSIGRSAESCGGTTPDTSIFWGTPSWKAALKKKDTGVLVDKLHMG